MSQSKLSPYVHGARRGRDGRLGRNYPPANKNSVQNKKSKGQTYGKGSYAKHSVDKTKGIKGYSKGTHGGWRVVK